MVGGSRIEITFVDPEGLHQRILAEPRGTLMEAAIAHEAPSIVGFCGGMCNCGTCHCYVQAPWAQRLSPPDANELDTLQRVLDRRDASRLACQIRLDSSLDGLVVSLPARQRTP